MLYPVFKFTNAFLFLYYFLTQAATSINANSVGFESLGSRKKQYFYLYLLIYFVNINIAFIIHHHVNNIIFLYMFYTLPIKQFNLSYIDYIILTTLTILLII